MRQNIRDHIASLYGDTVARAIAPRLDALLDKFRPVLPLNNKSSRRRLTEQDVLLLTYPDQIREAGVAPLHSLHAFATAHLRRLVSGIHLLPFYPWSSDDGFAVKDYFSVDPAYGTWENISRLGVEFDLMFDAVVNHVSAQSDWFKRFIAGDPRYSNFFITVDGNPDLSQVVRPRTTPLLTEFQTVTGPKKVWTTFSAEQVDLNYKNPDTLLTVLEALLFYVAKGARFIRLDAVAYLWKEPGTPCIHLPQTHRIVQLMRAVLDEVAPHVMLGTETNVPHAENISYFGNGTNEAQLVYNFALPPLVLHAFHNGNASDLANWARALALPSENVAFLNFLASHDGIGLNGVRGILSEAEIEKLAQRAVEHGGFISYKALPNGSKAVYELNINYLDALSNPGAAEPAELAARKLLTAHAIMLSLPGVPIIYFHSLFGSRGDRAAAETSGILRRINRQKLDRAALERELADLGTLRTRAFNGLRLLLELRRAHAAFAPSALHRVLDLDKRVFGVLRQTRDGKQRILCLHNVSEEEVSVTLPACLARNCFVIMRGCAPGLQIKTPAGVVPALQPWETLWCVVA